MHLNRPDAPDELSIFRSTKGGAHDIPFSLRPLEVNGQVTAWSADIDVRVRTHLYLNVTAEWREDEDPDGCRERFGGTWSFHLKTRRA